MARSFVAARSQYFSVSQAVLAASPATVVCWARVPANGTQRDLISVGDTTTTNNIRLAIRSTGGTRVYTNVGPTSTTVTGVGNRWHHRAGVLFSSSSQAAYIDGDGEVIEDPAATPSGLDTTVIGAVYSSGVFSGFHNGDIEYPAMWDVALTRAELWALAHGVFPALIRPQNLVFLGDTRAATPDLVNIAPYRNKGLRLVNNGGTIAYTDAFPPLQHYPPRRKSIYERLDTVAAAAGIAIPVLTRQYRARWA